ncbi:MAG: hypothetical protein KGZ63_00010 [Clostridiales bacterium]|jgi:hypothetical protein|nr:hypothetical protein [Clostridiales bacterium]
MKRLINNKTFSVLQIIFLALVLGTAVYIIVFDKGISNDHARGAGDIWWVDVPAIEEAYRELEQNLNVRLK